MVLELSATFSVSSAARSGNSNTPDHWRNGSTASAPEAFIGITYPQQHTFISCIVKENAGSGSRWRKRQDRPNEIECGRFIMSQKEKQTKAANAERIRFAFPGIYSDFIAGRITSLRLALELAGLRQERTRLQKLKNSWGKASAKERDDFILWLAANNEVDFAATGHGMPKDDSLQKQARQPIANGRYLLPVTTARIEAIMTRRGMTPSDIMQEIGFGAHDRSLLKAMARKAALRLKVIAALEHWLLENEQG
jgi:hypothetical protein